MSVTSYNQPRRLIEATWWLYTAAVLIIIGLSDQIIAKHAVYSLLGASTAITFLVLYVLPTVFPQGRLGIATSTRYFILSLIQIPVMSVIIAFSGGLDSPLQFILYVPLLASAMVVSLRQIYLTFVWVFLCYSVMAFMLTAFSWLAYGGRMAGLTLVAVLSLTVTFERRLLMIRQRRQGLDVGGKQLLSRLEGLNDISDNLMTQVDTEKLLSKIISEACQMFGFSAGWINTIEPDGHVIISAVYNLDSKLQDTILLPSIDNIKQLEGEDIMQYARSQMASRVLNKYKTKIYEPITLMGKQLGSINLVNERKVSITDIDRRMLTHVSKQAAVAINNSRLYQDGRRRIYELSVLNELSKVINHFESDINQSINDIIDIILFTFNAQASVFYVYDNAKHLVPKINRYLPKEFGKVLDDPKAVGRLAAGRSLRDKDIVKVESISTDPAYQEMGDSLIKHNLNYVIAVPLVAGDERVGVIETYFNSPKQFKNQDIELLSTIANQSAVAIQEANLHFETEATKDKDEAILAGINDGLVVVDTKLKVDFFNPAADRITSWTQAEAIGKPVKDIFTQKQIIEAVNRALIAGKPQHLSEIEYMSREGKLKHLSFQIAPNKVGDELVGVIVLFHDITRETELKHAKDEFISVASHEMRTPATAIRGNLEQVLRGEAGNIPEDMKVYLEDAYSGSISLLQLINSMLNVRRLEEGRMSFRQEEVNLNMIVKVIVSSLEILASEKGLKLLFEPEEVPLILGDSSKIQEIITNLVGNAIKFTQKGYIKIDLRDEGNFVRVSIMDTGEGIRKEDIDRLFKKFSQVESAALVHRAGTGLGLYISKSFVEKMGGQINVDSRYGVGSTFSFTLPVIKSTKKKAAALSGSSRKGIDG